MTPNKAPDKPPTAIDLIALRRLEIDPEAAAIPPQQQGELSLPTALVAQPRAFAPLPLHASRLETMPVGVFHTLARFLEPADLAALAQNSSSLAPRVDETFRVFDGLAIRQTHEGQEALRIHAAHMADPIAAPGPAATSAHDRMPHVHAAAQRNVSKALYRVAVACAHRTSERSDNENRPNRLHTRALRLQNEFESNTDRSGTAVKAAQLHLELGNTAQALQDFEWACARTPFVEGLTPPAEIGARVADELRYKFYARDFESMQGAMQAHLPPFMQRMAANQFHVLIGQAYLCLGDFEKAKQVLDMMQPAGLAFHWLNTLVAHSRGNAQEFSDAWQAYKPLAQMLTLDERAEPLALLWGWLGKADLALPHLEWAIKYGNVSLVHNPLLDPLRDDEYFQMLLRRFKLTPEILAQIPFELHLPEA